MLEVILAVGVGVFMIHTGFNIAYLVSVKRTSDRTREFFEKVEVNLNTTLGELAGTLENMRKISGNVNAVAEDVRQISHSVANVEKSMRDSLAYVKASLGAAAEAHLAGLKAGISTGVVTLVRNLQEERSDDHEGGA